MIPLDTQVRAARMLEAGRVTVTFTSPSGQHITIQAKCRKKDGEKWVGSTLAEAMVMFLAVPNHDGGFDDKVGKVTCRGGFVPDPRADQARVYCARMLLKLVAGEALPENLQAQEEDRCGRCGRQLTDPVSILRGIGPECYGKETGSQHQTKVKVSDGKDKKGVAYGHGDWRARAEVLADAQGQSHQLALIEDRLGPAPAHAYQIPY